MKNLDKEKYQDPYQYIGFLIWVIGNIFGQSMDSSSANKDKMLFSNFMVLAALFWLLSEKKSVNQRALAKYIHLREITVSTIIKKLTEQGYVSIAIDKLDKRSKSLQITAKGVGFLRTMLDDVVEKESKLNGKGLDSLKHGLKMLLRDISHEH